VTSEEKNLRILKEMRNFKLFIFLMNFAVNYAVSVSRIKRGGNAVLTQGEMPSIINKGADPTNSFTLEEPPGKLIKHYPKLNIL